VAVIFFLVSSLHVNDHSAAYEPLVSCAIAREMNVKIGMHRYSMTGHRIPMHIPPIPS